MSELKLITMDSVQVKEIDWLWYPYIPMGKITIIEGDPGQGKTSLVLKIAAILSNGGILMGDTEKRGVNLGKFGNPDLKWERANQFDIGIDLSLWNRIHVTADYYHRKRSVFRTWTS